MDRLGWTLAVSSTLSTTLVIPLVRGAVVGGMNPITILLLRLLIATVLLVVTIAFTQPARFRIDQRGAYLVTGIGLISGIEIIAFFWSLAYVTGSMTAMIKSVQPLAVLLLLAAGGEALTRRHMVRVALAIGGIYLLVGIAGEVAPFGLFLLAISLVLYTLQLVYTQWYLREYETQTITLYMLIVMTVVIAGWWWGQGIE